MAKYEVFISFKNSDEHKQPTPDADMAQSLYFALEERGIHTFYSNISLKESGESSFRKAIDAALSESHILVANALNQIDSLSAQLRYKALLRKLFPFFK